MTDPATSKTKEMSRVVKLIDFIEVLPIWSAPAERSDDGALGLIPATGWPVSSSVTRPLTEYVRASEGSVSAAKHTHLAWFF